MKYIYITVILNLRPPKANVSNVWDMDILLRYVERLEDNNLLILALEN